MSRMLCKTKVHNNISAVFVHSQQCLFWKHFMMQHVSNKYNQLVQAEFGNEFQKFNQKYLCLMQNENC